METISPDELQILENVILLTVVMDTATAPGYLFVVSAYVNGKKENDIPRLLDMELENYLEIIKPYQGRLFRNSLIYSTPENARQVINNIIMPILQYKGFTVQIREGVVY